MRESLADVDADVDVDFLAPLNREKSQNYAQQDHVTHVIDLQTQIITKTCDEVETNETRFAEWTGNNLLFKNKVFKNFEETERKFATELLQVTSDICVVLRRSLSSQF